MTGADGTELRNERVGVRSATLTSPSQTDGSSGFISTNRASIDLGWRPVRKAATAAAPCEG